MFRLSLHPSNTSVRANKPSFKLIKSVAMLSHYARVAYQAARRYLDGLAVVHDPQVAHDLLDQTTRRASFRGRKRRALNPLSREEQRLFLAVLLGEHHLRGFRSRDLTPYLNEPPPRTEIDKRRQSARIRETTFSNYFTEAE